MSGDTIVVRDLCEKIGKTSAEIIKKLFLLGNMATINSEIDFDTASLVCADFDITLEKKPEVTAEDQLTAENFDDSEENLQPRPPVVTIMGTSTTARRPCWTTSAIAASLRAKRAASPSISAHTRSR